MIEPAGTQLWADVVWHDGWRVQRRFDDREHRLVDPRGRVIVRGDAGSCEHALAEQAPEGAPHNHLVVLLHGLGRTRRALMRMDRALTDAGLSTARLDYPSTRRPIEAHAATLASLLDRLPSTKRLSFVTHSLGGLIVRALFEVNAPWRDRIHRIVMLAPPNRGASLARSLDRGGLLRNILGPSYAQIAEGFAERLPTPDVSFAIYAGDAPGVPGDGLLTVDETRLEGAAAHEVVPALHTFIMNHPAVLSGTARFLTAAPE